MTMEQKNKILGVLAGHRDDYVNECEKTITAEQGKIIGANYMLQSFIDVLSTEIERNGKE